MKEGAYPNHMHSENWKMMEEERCDIKNIRLAVSGFEDVGWGH